MDYLSFSFDKYIISLDKIVYCTVVHQKKLNLALIADRYQTVWSPNMKIQIRSVEKWVIRPHTVAILKIISVKNARAWVSMVSYLKK